MISALVLSALIPGVSPLWGDLESGPYRVGFEQIESFDYSRPYREGSGLRARPITMSIWYPAGASESRGSEASLNFGRYVDGADGRDSFAKRLMTYGFSLSSAELEALFASPTAAWEKAPRAAGPFPLLIFETALTGPFYLNTVLCEYLASHGYIAVAIPSLPTREGAEPDYDLHLVDAQMRDMEFVIQELHDYPEAATGRMGLVAWSFGGVAQALLQMKNPEVEAVVSLDAATGYGYGQKLLESSLFYDKARATAAFFHATDSRQSDQVPKSFEYFDAVVRGPAYLLMLEGATHAEFTSIGSVVPRSIASSGVSAEIARRYRLLCLYVRTFLDASMKKDRAAQEFLEVAPTRHGFEGLVLSRKARN